MPQVIPAIVAVVKVAVAVAQVVSVVAQVASFFVKPKSPRNDRGNRGLALMVRESDHPRRLLYGRGRLGGIWFYTETVGPSNETLWLVLGVCEGKTEGVVSVYFSDELIDLEFVPAAGEELDHWIPVEDEERGGKYRDHAKFTFHHGDQTTADARMVAASAGNWTENCKLLGITYAVVELEYDSDLFGGGVPEISFLWDGAADVFDPRTDEEGFTDNAMLCLTHYFTRSRIGPNADRATEIDAAAEIEAANVCDEIVETLAGSEKRYTCDGIISLEQGPEANIAAMLTAMGGFSTYAGGRFTFGAASWRPPSFEITEDMIVRVERFQNKVPKRDRTNTVKGLFVSEVNLYQSSDFPTRTKSSYVEADGEELVLDLDLKFTESPSRAQRLANIELEDRRLQRSLSIECTLEAFRAQAGKNVMVSISRYGLNRAPFLVEGFSFVIGDGGALNVSLVLNETSSSVYDWTTADELPVPIVPALENDGVKVATILAEPPPGNYLTTDFPMDVTLSTLTPGAAIRWSKSIVPDNIASGNEYVGPVEMSANDPLFAGGFKTDYADSDVRVGVYAVEQVERPTLAPEGGTFPVGDFPLDVSASTVTPGAAIRWKLGSAPSSPTDGSAYVGPVPVADGDELFVRAFKPGLVDSDETSGLYES